MLSYLATPYSKWPAGHHDAFVQASILASRLILRGIIVYAPIPHTHPIALYGEIDPLSTNDLWLRMDEMMMERCDRIIVAQMDGWDSSRGVQHEIAFFEGLGRPIKYLHPYTLELNDKPHKM